MQPFKCPICFEEFALENIRLLKCGHSACHHCLSMSLAHSRSCHTCRAPASGTVITPFLLETEEAALAETNTANALQDLSDRLLSAEAHAASAIEDLNSRLRSAEQMAAELETQIAALRSDIAMVRKDHSDSRSREQIARLELQTERLSRITENEANAKKLKEYDEITEIYKTISESRGKQIAVLEANLRDSVRQLEQERSIETRTKSLHVSDFDLSTGLDARWRRNGGSQWTPFASVSFLFQSMCSFFDWEAIGDEVREYLPSRTTGAIFVACLAVINYAIWTSVGNVEISDTSSD